MHMTRTNIGEFAFYLVVFLVVNALSAHFQSPMNLDEGRGWDGIQYGRIAEQYLNHEPIQGNAPFCYRIGTPIISGLLKPHDLVNGFKLVNLGANFLTFAFFVVWIRIFVGDWRIRCLLALLLVSQWLAPFRMVYYYPVSTDNVQYMFLVLGFLCIYLARLRPVLGTVSLAAVVSVGVLFRESLLLLAVIFPFIDNPITLTGFWKHLVTFKFNRLLKLPRPIFILPLVGGVLGVACTHHLAHKTNDYSFLHTAVGWVYDKPWPTYVHALFIAFGPIVVLTWYNWRRCWEFLANNQALLMFLAGSCVLAYLGGTDTERFWFWTMPATYVLIGRSIEDLRPLLRSKSFLMLLGTSQIISQRIFWTLPELADNASSSLPVLTVLGSNFRYLDLYAYQGKRFVEVISLAQYVFLACVLMWWLHYRAVRRANTSPTSTPL